MAKDTTHETDDVEIIQSADERIVNNDDSFDDKVGFIKHSCVICMEVYDANKAKCIENTKLIISKCGCKYYIHKSCFLKWYKLRPTLDMNCMVCASEGEIVLSFYQKIIRKCSSRNCKFLMKMLRWVLVGAITWNIYILFVLLYDKVVVTDYMNDENDTYYDVIYDDDTIYS